MKGRIETLPPVEINIVKDHKENAALLFHPYFIFHLLSKGWETTSNKSTGTIRPTTNNVG